ncbi:hypothetical protein PoB_005757200 [Plakobranchus ocellatus]|uniref:Sushi domain-containing protein n=1 Tax=Plakobranchus ocellatus TaxID=259542 RepID=A0AAV4CIB5_9GAST|nr:hypothetical protein PoB_005757200 [Plakobranchus ocellatus]
MASLVHIAVICVSLCTACCHGYKYRKLPCHEGGKRYQHGFVYRFKTSNRCHPYRCDNGWWRTLKTECIRSGLCFPNGSIETFEGANWLCVAYRFYAVWRLVE